MLNASLTRSGSLCRITYQRDCGLRAAERTFARREGNECARYAMATRGTLDIRCSARLTVLYCCVNNVPGFDGRCINTFRVGPNRGACSSKVPQINFNLDVPADIQACYQLPTLNIIELFAYLSVYLNDTSRTI